MTEYITPQPAPAVQQTPEQAMQTLTEIHQAIEATAVQPKGLFIDLIAQHEGLAEELKAMDAVPVAPKGEQICEEQRRALIAYGDARESKDQTRIAETFAAALYTAAPQVPAVQPLTIEKIELLFGKPPTKNVLFIVRVVEKYYGIGAPKE